MKYYIIFQVILYILSLVVLPLYYVEGGHTDWDVYDGITARVALVAAILIGPVQYVPAWVLQYRSGDKQYFTAYLWIASLILLADLFVISTMLDSDVWPVVHFALLISGLITGIYYIKTCIRSWLDHKKTDS